MGKLRIPGFGLRELLAPENRIREIFQNPPTLETERLRLRRLGARDARDLYEWSSDPEVARYVLWDAHESIAETRAYLRYMKGLYRRGYPSSWGIEEKESGKVIGTIGIMAWYPEHGNAEVGYSLGRAWWHRGYAPEALERVIRLLFDETDVCRVEAQCDTRNLNSARVMEKCGMRREGILRGRICNKGERVDVMMYARLREDQEPERSGR